MWKFLLNGSMCCLLRGEMDLYISFACFFWGLVMENLELWNPDFDMDVVADGLWFI